MHKILRFIRQNRVKLMWGIIFIVFTYTMILTANNAYKKKGNQELEKTKNQVVTIEADPTVNLSSKNREKLINNFLNYCTKGNYEEAYSFLSNDCKEYLYTSVDSFEKDYCIPNKIKGKGYSIEKDKDISDYTYRISFNNMLSSGKVKTDLTYDYYTITVDNGNDLKLNINSYLKTKEINKNKEVNNLEINVKYINFFADYQEVVISFNNKTKQSILISENINAINNKQNKIEQTNSESKIIKAGEELTLNFRFNVSPEEDLNKLSIEDLKFNYNLKNEQEENVEIDL